MPELSPAQAESYITPVLVRTRERQGGLRSDLYPDITFLHSSLQMSLFSELDKKSCYRLSEALYGPLSDMIATSLPTGLKLKPITTRKELESRKFLIAQAKQYHQAVLEFVGHDISPVPYNPEDGCGTFAKCIEEAEQYVRRASASPPKAVFRES